MARPVPYPEGRDAGSLHSWAIKLTQYLREKFAPQDTIPEIAAPAAEGVPLGAGILWGTAIPLPADYVTQNSVVLRADYPDLFDLWGTTYNTGSETALEFRIMPVASTATYVWIFKALP